MILFVELGIIIHRIGNCLTAIFHWFGGGFVKLYERKYGYICIFHLIMYFTIDQISTSIKLELIETHKYY